MFSGIGPGSLILVLIIVVLLFGTKKLRNLGSDLGGALRNFKKGMKDEDKEETSEKQKNVIEGESSDKDQ